LDVFDRIVCGIDDSDAGLEAVRQAASLAHPGGRLVALAVFDEALASEAGWAAASVARQLERDVERSVERVRKAVPAAAIEVVKGRPVPCLLAAIAREEAKLVAVGTHNVRRTPGIVIGSVSTALLHQAPCSVLVARPVEPEGFPRSLVAGLDGSPQSATALAVARVLAGRTGASLRAVVATKGKDVDLKAAKELASECEEDERSPVRALVERSKQADLLIVGSRGLHGLKSLGSVSERVAHEAACSVLVVR
jgi:nucleotide-binding universal stress UspA family protein